MNHGRKGVWRVMLYAILLAMFSLLSPVQSSEEPAKTALTPAEIAEKHGPSVILVMGLDAEKQSTVLGTGFLVSPTGVFVTNYHVVQGIYPAQIKLANGDVYDSISVIDADQRKDIAVLKIGGFNLPTAPLGDSDSVKIGSKVVVIGNPKGLEGTVTDGLISSTRDTGEGYKLFQMSAAISPGSSGSPVFGEDGQVIGIAVAALKDGQNLNFAIPINYARGMISDKGKMSLEEFSRAPKEPLLAGSSSPTAAVDAEEWGKRMASAIQAIEEGADNALFGEWETCEPHRKKFRAEQFAISSCLYIAKEKFLAAAKQLAEFSSKDAELEKLRTATLELARKNAECVDRTIQLFRTVLEKNGFAEFNALYGEVMAITTQTTDNLAKCLSTYGGFVGVFDKYCPKQSSLLPLQQRLRARMEKEKTVPKVMLGFQPWRSVDAVRVLAVIPNSAADKGGLKPGDVIVGIKDSVKFNDMEDYTRFQCTANPGDAVNLEILRGFEKKTIKVKLTPAQQR